MVSKYISLVIALSLAGRQVTSLSCYTCTASLGNQMKCENLSNSGGSIPYNPCFYNDAVCAKYVIEYYDSVMIHRGCTHRDICYVLSSRYKNNNYYHSLFDCQTCSDHDYCNSAINVKINAAAMIAVILLATVRLF